MDQLLEVINGGFKYTMEVKKEEQNIYSQGEQNENGLEALHQARLQKIHEEFLARYNFRDTDAVMEAIEKLEETSNKRRKASQDGEKRRRIQEHIFVGLVVNIC
ncbi:uncharacterized protein LOC144620417 [Crassostrea virginica]